ncbi:VOC family protein [Olivibacter sp. XZL3]|uniref:VOC family protein n=1 Tax=Olivibacter sp. XZL3 TaxID=1735116 RepID=UPI001065E76A|nr:VOC family protein [Olivibacter sp. XZL3]
MRIDHVAIWVKDLEISRNFYSKYFNMKSNERYNNPRKSFCSYFLSFEENNTTRIELMQRPDVLENKFDDRGMVYGLAHLAISVGSKNEVDRLTELLRSDGYRVVGEPRTTGDGYYESVIADCDGNWIEITA